MPQQLNFDTGQLSGLWPALVLSGLWIVAFWLYRLARWYRRRCPRHDLRQLEGRLVTLERTTTGEQIAELVAADGTHWRIAFSQPGQFGPAMQVLVRGIPLDTSGYRAASRTMHAVSIRRSWPAIAALELPTALLCVVHLLVAVTAVL